MIVRNSNEAAMMDSFILDVRDQCCVGWEALFPVVSVVVNRSEEEVFQEQSC